MRQILFATTNKGKVSQINTTLNKYGVEALQAPLDIPEPRSDEVQMIAETKVRYAYDKLKEPCFAIDGGFYIPSLNGFPKAYVNFVLDTIDISGILKLVEQKNRECEFRDCLSYLDSQLTLPYSIFNIVPGTLATEPRGEKREYAWGRLWFIFIPKNEIKTLAEMTPDEFWAWKERESKNSVAEQFGSWMSDESGLNV